MEDRFNEVSTFRQMNLLKWVLVFTTLLLVLLTFLSMSYVDRFYVEEDQVLQDPDFLSGEAHWKSTPGITFSTSDNRVTIANNLGAGHKVFQNIVVDTPSFYRFEFDAAVKDVVSAGSEAWENANVAVIYRDKNGDRTGSIMLAGLLGTQAARQFSEQLLLRESVGSIDFAVRLYNSGGEFTVASPVVSRLQEYPFYKNTRVAIIVAWAVLLIALAILLVRTASVGNLLALACLVGVALVGVVMPESLMTALNLKIASFIPQSFLTESRKLLGLIYDGNRLVNPGSEISKIGHLVVFTLLGILAGLSWQKVGIIFAVTSLVVFALVTEVLQMFVNGRTTSFGDLITDIVGGLVGVAIGVFLLWCVRSIRNLRKNPESMTENHARTPENTNEYY